MEILKIKELEIPIEIKNYSNSKSVKIYFKSNIQKKIIANIERAGRRNLW